MINKPFKILKENEGGQIFAKYLPEGKAWTSKNNTNSNLFKIINSLSLEDNRFRYYLNSIFYQFDINITNDFLEEWEKQLGIPDDCFNTTVSIDRRRRQCLAKIYARGVQTPKELQDIIGLLGYSATITTKFAQDPLSDPNVSSYELLITFLDTSVSTIFPVTFPWYFGENGYLLTVECFILKLIPSNCDVSFGRTNLPIFKILMQNNDNFILQNNDILTTN